jgi:hypothetical protein
MRARSEATNERNAQENHANEGQASGGGRIGLCGELVAQYH